MRSWPCCILIPAVLLSCSFRHDGGPEQKSPDTQTPPGYATGFQVSDRGSFRILRVTDPWQYSQGVVFSYVLARERELVPDSLRELPFIRIPVERVITLSTTHVAMIRQLGMENSMVGSMKGLSSRS